MNLAKYQALLSVVESGSLTAAAAQLGLTQSAVSHSINSLEEELGFAVIKRSRAGVQEYLARYPSIKVVLDVHRDAIEDADGTRVKPVWVQDGESMAQVMVIAGCDNGGSIALPNWRLNLRLAAAWEAAMEEAYPGLTRPVLCGYRFYNQDLTTGSLLIEVGGHANTLDEAIRAGRYAAEGLAKIL